MRLLHHKTSWGVTPMFIIDDKIEYITEYIWHTSKSVKHLPCEFISLTEVDVCPLDPGGMYCLKIPHSEFKIDDFKFSIQLSRIEEVIRCMKMGRERIPGYIRFPNFRCFIIIPKMTFEKLMVKLKELEMSDEALSFELKEKDIRDDLRNSPGLSLG
jgi:hypothetical protein